MRVDWIDLAQDRDKWRVLANVLINLGVPYSAGYFLTSWGITGFSRIILLQGISGFVTLQSVEAFGFSYLRFLTEAHRFNIAKYTRSTRGRHTFRRHIYKHFCLNSLGVINEKNSVTRTMFDFLSLMLDKKYFK
jgi:hypothetical protein